MKNSKNRIIIALLCVTAIFVVSCKDEILDESKDRPRQSVQEESFAFSRTVRLETTDGLYWKDLKVSSDSEKTIDEFLSQKPQIKVYKTPNTDVLITGSEQQIQNPDTVEDRSPTNTISSEFMGGNIPSGYSMEVYYATSGSVKSASGARVSASYNNYEFTDGLAKSVKTTVNGSYQVAIGYFSKGCCWYSVGYYDRGYITHYGPNYSYTFVANPTYTPYLGVKYKFKTTLAAAQSITRVWGYGSLT